MATAYATTCSTVKTQLLSTLQRKLAQRGLVARKWLRERGAANVRHCRSSEVHPAAEHTLMISAPLPKAWKWCLYQCLFPKRNSGRPSLGSSLPRSHSPAVLPESVMKLDGGAAHRLATQLASACCHQCW